jgi:hypothetical protein
MPRVGFEPTIPVFQRAKTVHALDRAVTMIGIRRYSLTQRQSRQTNYKEINKCEVKVEILSYGINGLTKNALLCVQALVSCVSAELAHVCKLKTEAGCSFEMVVPTHDTRQRLHRKEHNMTPHRFILSRVYGCVTINNGFWIG